MYQCSSLTRCDTVKRRQLIRMKKRSTWFLAPTPASTTNNTSSSSSSSTCGGGRGSLDGWRTSTDVLMVDTDTMTDNSQNNSLSVFTPIVIPHTTTVTIKTMTTSTPDNSHQRHKQSPYLHHLNDVSVINRSLLSPYPNFDHHAGSDVSGTSLSSSSSALTPSPVNQPNTHGNHSILSTPDYVNGNHQQHNNGSRSANTAQNTSSPIVTERDVRYFMVENWYGTPVSGKNAAVTQNPSS